MFLVLELILWKCDTVRMYLKLILSMMSLSSPIWRSFTALGTSSAIAVLADGFFRPGLVLILGAFSFTTVGVFILVTDNSVPIVPLIFLSHGLLQENCICYLGTLLTNSNDRIRFTMKSFDWYLLPHNLQTNYQIMMHHMDQPRDIYIGGISRLSLETSVLIMRSLYSYTMILLSLET
ncbi:hypothetical protein Bhyg_08640, partial [Pseudolycoriella hygida]